MRFLSPQTHLKTEDYVGELDKLREYYDLNRPQPIMDFKNITLINRNGVRVPLLFERRSDRIWSCKVDHMVMGALEACSIEE